MIPKPHPRYKKLLRARHNERNSLIVEYVVYFIFDLRNIRKKNHVPYVEYQNEPSGLYRKK